MCKSRILTAEDLKEIKAMAVTSIHGAAIKAAQQMIVAHLSEVLEVKENLIVLNDDFVSDFGMTEDALPEMLREMGKKFEMSFSAGTKTPQQAIEQMAKAYLALPVTQEPKTGAAYKFFGLIEEILLAESSADNSEKADQ